MSTQHAQTQTHMGMYTLPYGHTHTCAHTHQSTCTSTDTPTCSFIRTLLHTHTHAHTRTEPGLQAQLAPSGTCADTADVCHNFGGEVRLTDSGLWTVSRPSAGMWVVEMSHGCTCFLLPADTDLGEEASEPADVTSVLLTGPPCLALERVWSKPEWAKGRMAGCPQCHPLSSRASQSPGAVRAPQGMFVALGPLVWGAEDNRMLRDWGPCGQSQDQLMCAPPLQARRKEIRLAQGSC